MYSCGSKHLSPRRPTPAVDPTTPPQKPEGSLWPVGTSSQVSAETAEASLEDIPTRISPTAAISRTGSITPPVDELELWANANIALKDFLTTKASIDAHRQGTIWKLGVVLCQNKSQAAESIKEAKAACSQATLDTQTTCSQLTLEAKSNCSWAMLEVKTTFSMVVKKAKTTRGHMVQEAEATCSKAISEVEAQRASQAESFQREHGNIMWDLEEQVIKRRAEVKLTSSPPVKLPCTTAHQSLKALWLLPTISYWGKHLWCLHLPCCRELPLWKGQLTSAALPTQAPEQSPRSKRQQPSPDPVESMPLGRTTLKATLGGPPSSKRWEVPPWFRTLKPSCIKAFSLDSDLVREARREFFSKHSYNFTTDGNCNLSKIFWQLAMSTGLLGTSIYEIQASWAGPKELKQANYALWSLPKGLRFLHVIPPSESPKVMGLVGIHDLDALSHFSVITYWPWCRKEGQNEGTMVNHLQTMHYRLGLVCNRCHDCPSTMSNTLCHHDQ